MKLTRVFTVVVVAAGVYFRFLRSPILTWGATDSEAGARLAADELLEDADGVSIRAVNIGAPASAVWPWIAQMGPAPRGGAYTYDWIENLLGLDMHSVDRVLPEFQHSADRRHDRLRAEPNAPRAPRARACPRLAFLRRQLGVDVRPRGERELDADHQPQPLWHSDALRLGSACSRWSRRRSSWSRRCCGASESVRNGSPQRPRSATSELPSSRPFPTGTSAVFGLGCFWGAERLF